MSHINILVFDGVEELDFVGPLEVFGVAGELGAPLELCTVALKKGPITCAHGLKIVPHYDADFCPPMDVLVVPGGKGRRREMKNPKMLERLWEWAAGCKIATSVCTGSLLFAAAGLLAGKRATTHWSALEELRCFPDVSVEQRRYIHEGALITAAGVTSGIDMALYVVGLLFGKEMQKAVAKQMEYPIVTPEGVDKGDSFK
jgi:transcriptional regulator GlxA family with amidase domain